MGETAQIEKVARVIRDHERNYDFGADDPNFWHSAAAAVVAALPPSDLRCPLEHHEAVEALAQEFWRRDLDGNEHGLDLTWEKARGDHNEYRREARAFLSKLRGSGAPQREETR